MKFFSISVFALSALALSGVAATGLRPYVEAPAVPQGLDSQESVAGATLLGQFRTSFSSWMWVRTDLYLHNGVSMRMLSEQELAAGVQGVGADDDGTEHDLHDDSKLVTVVPEPSRDFRGILGDIDRATKAWKDMRGHGHNDPKAALPLFRLMTWFDPHFIPGFSVGAAVIARDRNDVATAKALNLLREGLKHNPDSVTLLSDTARYHITRKQDLAGAEGYLRQAISSGLENFKRLPEMEVEALNHSFRWLAIVYRDMGRFGDMLETSRRGLSVFPDDAVLERHANPPPSILQPKYHQDWLKQSSGATVEEPEEDHH